ncbi:hypothetical protein HanXRQr2_Chr07g0308301 [Helianthus annuus]|uniref:Uncharacterized protein n=1 Tax=Helianthus annuus TaxID=4232 RepID=A0A9K3INF6_HELAN|nr:hypothetical protein HanXRQr2_Chr07g0308301 [Helianthus annuus]
MSCVHDSLTPNCYLSCICKQWRIQKLFAGSTDEVFNHIFKGCGHPPWPKSRSAPVCKMEMK